jgi:hypothetical protein
LCYHEGGAVYHVSHRSCDQALLPPLVVGLDEKAPLVLWRNLYNSQWLSQYSGLGGAEVVKTVLHHTVQNYPDMPSALPEVPTTLSTVEIDDECNKAMVLLRTCLPTCDKFECSMQFVTCEHGLMIAISAWLQSVNALTANLITLTQHSTTTT